MKHVCVQGDYDGRTVCLSVLDFRFTTGHVYRVFFDTITESTLAIVLALIMQMVAYERTRFHHVVLNVERPVTVLIVYEISAMETQNKVY